jgi:hypothetical protein
LFCFVFAIKQSVNQSIDCVFYMDYWNSRVQWALGVAQRYAQSEPKFDSKAFWQWRCATLELAAMDKNCRETGPMPLYALRSVNFSVLPRDQCMDALYADVTHVKNWDVAASPLRRMHPDLASLLKLVTLNTYNPEKKRGRTEEATLAAVERRERVRGVAFEGILSQLQRLRSQHNAPFLTVLKSMVAFRQGLNKGFWKAESAQKLLMSYTWTHAFVIEMTNRPRELPFAINKTISFVVYDNCDYHRKKAYDRTDDDAEYVKTVQLVGVPVSADLPEINQQEIGARTHPETAQEL